MIVTGEDGVRVVGRYDCVSGRGISRGDLDLALLMAAAGAGARIEQGVLVQGPLVDSSERAPTVNGLHVSRTTRKVARRFRHASSLPPMVDIRRSLAHLVCRRRRDGRRRWAIGAYFENVVGLLPTFGEMHVRRTHYMGVAPLASNITNACIVTPNPVGRVPGELLQSTLRRDSQLGERFGDARMITEPICLGPLSVDACAAGAPGLLLAGDAAGFVDPITGDGLRFAIRGAELAARQALDALEHGFAAAHVQLLASRRREFAAKWRFNRTMRWIVTYPSAVRAAEYGVAIIPQLLKQAIRYAGDVQRGVMVPLIVLALAFLPMAFEARLAGRHDRALRAAGAFEPDVTSIRGCRLRIRPPSSPWRSRRHSLALV